MSVFWGYLLGSERCVNAIELDVLQHLTEKKKLWDKLEIFRQRSLRVLRLVYVEIAACRLKVFGLPGFTSGILTLSLFSLKKENHF